MEEFVARLWHEENGQALIEYALFLVLVSLIAVSTMRSLAFSVDNIYSHTATELAVRHATIRTDKNHEHDFLPKKSSSQANWDERFKNKNETQ